MQRRARSALPRPDVMRGLTQAPPVSLSANIMDDTDTDPPPSRATTSPSRTSASPPASSRSSPTRASPNPSPSSASRSPTRSPAATSAARPRPAPARPSPSACRCSSGSTRPSPASPAASCSCPPASWPSRCTTCSRRWPRPSARRVVAVYGGADMNKQIKALAERRRGDHRHAGPPDRPRRPQGGRAQRPRDRRRRRSRPHGRHGLPAAGRVAAAPHRRPAPDAAVLGHARRRRRRADQALPARSRVPRGRVATVTVDAMIHRFIARPRDGQGEGGRGHRPRQRPHARLHQHQARAPTGSPGALNEEGVHAAAIHGDLRQGQREDALKKFSDGQAPGARRHRRRRPRAPHRRRRRRHPLRAGAATTRPTCTAPVAPPGPGRRAWP